MSSTYSEACITICFQSESPMQGKSTTCILQELCPIATGEEIGVARQESGADPNVAAQNLLGG